MCFTHFTQVGSKTGRVGHCSSICNLNKMRLSQQHPPISHLIGFVEGKEGGKEGGKDGGRSGSTKLKFQKTGIRNTHTHTRVPFIPHFASSSASRTRSTDEARCNATSSASCHAPRTRTQHARSPRRQRPTRCGRASSRRTCR